MSNSPKMSKYFHETAAERAARIDPPLPSRNDFTFGPATPTSFPFPSRTLAKVWRYRFTKRAWRVRNAKR